MTILRYIKRKAYPLRKTQPYLLLQTTKTGSIFISPSHCLQTYSHLTDNQKQMLAVLIEASVIMDDLFWQQAFAQDKNAFLSRH